MRARSLGVALLRGIRPVERRRILPDAVAGLTLAALAIPEVLGYARIAGMPLETGLYTLFVPVVAFAVLVPAAVRVAEPEPLPEDSGDERQVGELVPSR